MRVLVWGVHHRTAELALREKLALDERRAGELLLRLLSTWPQAQFVVLSTCHRTEIYLARPIHQPPDACQLARLMADYCGLEMEPLLRSAVELANQQAVAHLFRVAGGLESMILGEEQILGQVRRAWELARRMRALGPMLDRLFQQAIAAARQVRRQTGLDRKRLSVGWAAGQWLRELWADLSDRTVLVLGAGTVAKLTLKQLKTLKPGRLILANRTLANAQVLSRRLQSDGLHCEVRPLSQVKDLLLDADVVLSAASGDGPMLASRQLESVMDRRSDRPLVVLDLAVPRTVEPAAAQVPGVRLCHLDDLQDIVSRRLADLGQPIQQAQQMLDQAALAALAGARNRELGALICVLRRRLEELGQRETVRTLRKLTRLVPSSQQEAIQTLVGEHTRRLVNKFLHIPLSQMNPRQAQVSPAFLAAAMRALFGLESAAEQTEAAGAEGGGGACQRLNVESVSDGALRGVGPRSEVQWTLPPKS